MAASEDEAEDEGCTVGDGKGNLPLALTLTLLPLLEP